MKNIYKSLFLGLALLTSTAAADNIRWASSLDAAAKVAAQSRRPLLVHFYSDQCGPCEQLDRVVFKDQQLVRAINQDVVAVKVDTRRQAAVARRFGIQAVPADVYLDSAGEVIGRMTSPRTAADYRAVIQQLKLHSSVPMVARTAPERDDRFSSIRQPSAGGR